MRRQEGREAVYQLWPGMSGCECKPDAKRKRAPSVSAIARNIKRSAQPEAKGAAIKSTVGPTLIYGTLFRKHSERPCRRWPGRANHQEIRREERNS